MVSCSRFIWIANSRRGAKRKYWADMGLRKQLNQIVSNKAKGWISKRVFQENKARQIFWKTNISYPLIRTCTLVLRFSLVSYYRGIRRPVLKDSVFILKETSQWNRRQLDTFRSSRLQMFLKIDVLKNIHWKTPVLEFLFNKVAGLKA